MYTVPVGAPAVQTVYAGRNVLTRHPAESYPGLRVIRPGQWDMGLIVPQPGQTIAAHGGEHVYAYETVDGGKAHAFELRPGDRATLMAVDLPYALAEWRIERAR